MKRFKHLLMWTIIGIIIGVFISVYVFKIKDNKVIEKVPVAISQLSDIKNIYKKLKMGDIITKKIIGLNEMITTEVELSQAVTLDSSWGSLDIFKKAQKITFYGKGIYTEDISKITKEDVNIDTKKNTIVVNVSKPQIKMVTIDEDKTEYEPIDKGLFRFGEIKLSTSENQIMLQEIKKRMTEEMQSTQTYGAALDNTKSSIKNMIKNILDDSIKNNYEVVVEFKD